ncbi:MAG: D-alanine--D-alanine ligase B [Alphaproteobacteria bacterium MarineAlpha9_Bin3]|nr:MAG: D-alanine--D-alanine ligase B [Alphaproteobacteria bacterium MarineAlpha9_Bin3]
MNILLLSGGYTEREVSLMSANAVKFSLLRIGHKVTEIDISKSEFLNYSLDNFDLVFNALHGGIGENGVIQSICEFKNTPYTGSAVLASSVAMNKVLAKKVFKSVNINIAKSTVSNIDDIKNKEPFDRPFIIKPIDGGSSIGVNIIDKDTILNNLKFNDKNFLVESYIEGKEVAVAVIDNKVLGMIEIKFEENFYDYKSKYESNNTKYIIPEDLSENQKTLLKNFALSAHTSLGCKGVTRSDFIVPNEESKAPVLLEINTLPGLTKHSLVPKIAKNNGLSFDDLITKIIEDALI